MMGYSVAQVRLFETWGDGVYSFHGGHARACVGTGTIEVQSHKEDSRHLSGSEKKQLDASV